MLGIMYIIKNLAIKDPANSCHWLGIRADYDTW